MNRVLLVVATVLLASCNSDPSASSESSGTSDSAAADSTGSVSGEPAVQMSLLNTSWEFSDEGTPMVISIDRAGGYIEERADGTHVDHGSYAPRSGKDCFTSAMGEKATNCWTAVPQTEIGGTASATADDGSSGVFERVDYRPLKLPE
jgi:hypothetical protein